MTKSLFELFCEPSGPAPQNLLTRDTLHFVEQLPFGALLADAQGHIAFGNSRAGQLLGTAKTAFEGGNIATFGLTAAEVASLLKSSAGQRLRQSAPGCAHALYRFQRPGAHVKR